MLPACSSLPLVLIILHAAKTCSILHCCSTAWNPNDDAGREEWGRGCAARRRLQLKIKPCYFLHLSTYVFWWIIFPCVSPEGQVLPCCKHWGIDSQPGAGILIIFLTVVFDPLRPTPFEVSCNSAACHWIRHSNHCVKAWACLCRHFFNGQISPLRQKWSCTICRARSLWRTTNSSLT